MILFWIFVVVIGLIIMSVIKHPQSQAMAGLLLLLFILVGYLSGWTQ